MFDELPGRGEFAELVPDHVLRDEHADKAVAIVDEEGVTDEVRNDHRCT